jgi:hypothetical protein
MVTRREFIFASVALGGLTALQACSLLETTNSYDQAVQSTWRHGKVDAHDKLSLFHELVRYATLAPSSHNTQCWRFHIEDYAISILPDFSRQCPIVDPDDHHLFVSLGCATENLIQASLANGLKSHAVFDDTSEGMLHMDLEPTKAFESTLYQAIPERQSTRGEYDGKSISSLELKMLERSNDHPNRAKCVGEYSRVCCSR